MTPDEIDKMEAGPEMDRMIYHTIMRASIAVKHWGDEKYLVVIPYYSTDIAAAWEVVEKLRSDLKIWDLALIWGRDDKHWKAGEYYDGGYDGGEFNCGYGKAPTAPLAICRAALKAVMK